MGRPEKPVDRTVPARAKLADFLRDRKADAGMTYEQMAEKTNGLPSKATFERAASGASIPTYSTVVAFVTVTETPQSFLMSTSDSWARAENLWICARRTLAPYYVHKAPDPRLISTSADLSRMLRHQHIWAGYPSADQMQRASDPGQLPASTTRRIIKGDNLPLDPKQTIAFLKACRVFARTDLALWLTAAIRAFEHDSGPTPGRSNISHWIQARDLLLSRPDDIHEEDIDELGLYRQKKERERVA
ncbi:hypothetical protein [Streptomyces prunicolor]|uniref:hypothetical protein n=1 Tax=Streptomyces prunicolor TaxID=67348 RepID=UPI0033EE1C8A